MADSAADTNTTTTKAIVSDVVPLPSPVAIVEPATIPAPTAAEPTIAPAPTDPPPPTAPDQTPPNPVKSPMPTAAGVTITPNTTAATAPAAMGQSQPPANAPQKFEIQLQNPIPENLDPLEAKVVIPWIVAVVGWGVAIALYFLTRKNKINDDLNNIVIEDIKEFLEKMEELTRLVASHQGGCPCQGADLKESRKHLSTLRQTAMAVSNRVNGALLNNGDSEEWKLIYREWKTATEGNTDWITNKNNKWSRDKMSLLELANEEYTGKIINFRNRVVTRKIKLKA